MNVSECWGSNGESEWVLIARRMSPCVRLRRKISVRHLQGAFLLILPLAGALLFSGDGAGGRSENGRISGKF